jgi:hypothetical protein
MTDADDTQLEAALARALGPGAEDTAPLSRAVLTRIAEADRPARPALAEVLVQPGPALGLVAGLLLLAGALGYALLAGLAEEAILLQALIGAGV